MNRSRRVVSRRVCALVACAVSVVSTSGNGRDAETSEKTEARLVAHYAFSKGEGVEVRDLSGNHNDGAIVGDYLWTHEGLQFDGASYVRVPDATTLDLRRGFSVVVSFRGKGSPFRAVERPKTGMRNNTRGPWLQVCGDQLSFAYNADVLDRDDGSSSSRWISFAANYGTALANLSSWNEHYLGQGTEPKIQRVFNKVYHEYFGPDGTGEDQIWAGVSDVGGSQYSPTQLTHVVPLQYGPGGMVEQGAMQVVGRKVYFAWPQSDATGTGDHLWTATTNLDDTGLKATQRTFVPTFVAPQMFVAGDSIYYTYADRGDRTDSSKKLYFAKSNLDGSNWRVIATIKNIEQMFGMFTVDKERLFFTYSKVEPDGLSALVTGSMNLDGTNVEATSREKHADVGVGSVQAIGDRVYYNFAVRGADSNPNTWGSYRCFIASTRRDGSDWEIQPLDSSDSTIVFGYTPHVVLGAKEYFGLTKISADASRHLAMLGTQGANLVAKGDSFGIGFTSQSRPAAFINAGQDYLCRGEAPIDTAGAMVSSSALDDQLHQLAAVYDGHTLRLFVDGSESSKAEYATPPSANDFPLLLGDGLVGTLKDIVLFSSTLSASEIAKLYREGMARVDRRN